MTGREDKDLNDLFFVCSIIEQIARETKNTRKDTVNSLNRENIKKLYDLADVYHCENTDKVIDEFIKESGIQAGNFDNVADCRYKVPSGREIGRVYQRLITKAAGEKGLGVIDALFEVYNSWITDYIDDYNSNMYYSNPDYIFQSYKEGGLIEE